MGRVIVFVALFDLFQFRMIPDSKKANFTQHMCNYFQT